MAKTGKWLKPGTTEQIGRPESRERCHGVAILLVEPRSKQQKTGTSGDSAKVQETYIMIACKDSQGLAALQSAQTP